MTDFIPAQEPTAQLTHIMPYAAFIGLQIGHDASGSPLFLLPEKRDNIGNIFLPALHGGLMAGFAESCATLFLMHSAQLEHPPKIINLSLDYLRSGHAQNLYARCHLTRQGKRIAHVSVSAWQSDPDKPVLLARVHFQMPAEPRTQAT